MIRVLLQAGHLLMQYTTVSSSHSNSRRMGELATRLHLNAFLGVVHQGGSSMPYYGYVLKRMSLVWQRILQKTFCVSTADRSFLTIT